MLEAKVLYRSFYDSKALIFWGVELGVSEQRLGVNIERNAFTVERLHDFTS